MEDYRVNIDVFAGPLDLLLYLVRKDEVDIYDISITKITEEYLRYIELMKELDLEIAGDFLVMAAALMEIKSAMLLPKSEVEQEDEQDEAINPRKELIRQLLEYKRFKDAANMLDDSASKKECRYSRPDVIMDKLEPDAEKEVEIEQISVWDLLSAFDSILKATGNYQDYSHIKDDTPIDLYQIEILHRLQEEGAMKFENIFEGGKNKLVLVGLFLGLLELIREKLVWVEQENSDEPIYVKALTNEPAEMAVRNAMLANVENEFSADTETSVAEEKAKLPISIKEISPKNESLSSNAPEARQTEQQT